MMNIQVIKDILSRVIEELSSQYSSSEIYIYVLKIVFLKRIIDLHYSDKASSHISNEISNIIIEGEYCHITELINSFFDDTESNYTDLQGFLADSDLNFGTKFDNKTLQHVIKLLSELDLKGKQPDDQEKLSQVVEWLIEKKASTQFNKGVYTPPQLTKLMVQLINPESVTSIYDPYCGSGEFLAEFVRFIRGNGGDISKIRIYGQAVNMQDYETTIINLMINDAKNINIKLGNAIFKPCFVEEGKLEKFDIVLLNPPFSLKYSPSELKEIPYHNQFPEDISKTSFGDFFYIYHTLKSLKDQGRAAIILPRGVLFRKGIEERLREDIVENDLIEAVIELAPKLFYQVSIPVTIIVFNLNKQNRGDIFFIDASREYKAGRGQNLLQPNHVNHIVSAYNSFREEEGFARLVSIREIAEQNYNLSVSRYIIPTATDQIDIAHEVEKLHRLEIERSELEGKIDHFLKALGIDI